MPRVKISEFRSKNILCSAFGLPYTGVHIDATTDWQKQIAGLSKTKRYVVKVDQGVKGRFKKGLVFLDRKHSQLKADILALSKKGYRFVLIEEFKHHTPDSESYLSIERTRAGNMVMFSTSGGINVESNAAAMKSSLMKPSSAPSVEQALGLKADSMSKLTAAFEDNYMAFLEINPLVVTDGVPQFLDAAIEVDSEAGPFVKEAWTVSDFRDPAIKTPEELVVEELASTSQASFRLKVANPNGSVFLLLSGGGASIVVADEVYNQGYGRELGNYGEYSGNPDEAETYLYTMQVISLMLKSKSSQKVLIIAGGVANFTDIRVTLQGVVRALATSKAALRRQHIKVFVRRAGPFDVEGLANLRAFLDREKLLGYVAGSELVLSEIVPKAVASLKAGE